VRVIAGEARGVPLAAPPGKGTRPTSDRTKEAIFAVLGDLGCEGRVLDLFAGSGALGIEALSRGATFCDFVEAAPAACRVIAANLAKTKLAAQGRVHQRTVERFVAEGSTPQRSPASGTTGDATEAQTAASAGTAASRPYDLILIDPPYAIDGLETVLRAVAGSALVGKETALLVEHASRRPLPPRLGPLSLVKSRAHGDSAFSLYRSLDQSSPLGSEGAPEEAATVY
jgi:16S rRNA (guanine966-N2)-methyltransferase